MRVAFFLLLTCLVMLVVVECKSKSKSKSPGSNTSRSGGKVTKIRAKPIRHSSDSSESSEEHLSRHKKKPKHSDKFKSEEILDSRKSNRSVNHKIGSKLNTTSVFGGGFNRTMGKHLLSNNATSLIFLKTNNTQLTGLNKNNETLIGWKTYAKTNMSKTNSANESNTLKDFLHNEKGSKNFTGLLLYSNNSNLMNKNKTPPSYGWKNTNATLKDFLHNEKDAKNFTGLLLHSNTSKLMKKNETPPSYGWKNMNATATSIGWKNIPDSEQGWNIQPSAPDNRMKFSIPDQRQYHMYYPSGSGVPGYFQRTPNSINDHNQPAPFPVGPEYNRKVISNIAPQYSWSVPQALSQNNDQFNTNGQVYNSYPIYNSYGSSKESSSMIGKGVKKMFKKLAKGTGKVLSSDAMKDAGKKVASSYFANPPPNGWIYNPPLGNPRQTFYGRFTSPVGKESLSADDWRSIIFGNVPMRDNTRNLYSAAFPETYQNLNLSLFSKKGLFPDLNQTQNIKFFPRPYYRKLFAGLHNEDMNEQFRAKRELSENGKAMANAINKFLMHERDCNDTELNARRKRQIIITPIAKKNGSRYDNENEITNFPFSGVEAVVQSDSGISVYEELPKEIQLDNISTEKSFINQQNTVVSRSSAIKSIFTAEPALSASQKRTILYPVSETIEEFLNKRPATRLRVIDESLDEWKARTTNNISSNANHSSLYSQKENTTLWKRITRSQDTSNESDFTPLYQWISDLQYSSDESEVLAPYVTEHYSDSFVETINDTVISSEKIFFENSNENIPTSYRSKNPTLNFDKEYANKKTSYDSADLSRKNGIYFFGMYIYDYNDELENHATSISDTLNQVSDEEEIDSFKSLEVDSSSEENTMTTSAPILSSNLKAGWMESTIAIPAQPYSIHRERLSTENIQPTLEPTFLEPTKNTRVPDSYTTSKPSESIYIPFKINSISSASYLDFFKKRSLRTNDPEHITPGPSIIKAPLITNRCGRNQRLVKGKCRMIW